MLWLAGITALAFVIRLWYIFLFKDGTQLPGDAVQYHGSALALADGHGFIEPNRFVFGLHVQSAQHPPAYFVVLAGVSAIGFRSMFAHQIFSAALGSVTVVLVGLTGRELSGRSAGLIAAFLVAAYPNIWLNDGEHMSETLAMLAIAVVLYVSYRLWRRPTVWRACALGGWCGLAALTRTEAFLMLPWLSVMVVGRLPGTARGRRVRLVTATWAIALLVMSPWVAYNLTRFNRPVLLSSGLGVALSAANCDTTYYGRPVHGSYFDGPNWYAVERTNRTGYWANTCYSRAVAGLRGDASDVDAALTRKSLSYAGEHLSRVPAVIAARLGRTWGFYRPAQQMGLDHFIEGRELPASWAGLAMYYLLLPMGILGAIVLHRKRVTLSPLVAPVLAVSAGTVVTFGQTRYRAMAEVALVLVSAVAVAELARAWQSRGRQNTVMANRRSAGAGKPRRES